MKIRWKNLIGIFAIVIVVVCIALLSIPGKSLKSHNFPLSEKWSTSVQGNIQQISMVGNQEIIIRTKSDVYAVDSTSGKIMWQKRIASHFVPEEPAMMMDNKVFLTDAEQVIALDQLNGKILWQEPLRYPSSAEVVDVSQDYVAVSDMPYLSLYRTEDGELWWSQWVCREGAQAYFLDDNIIVPCYGLKAMDIDTGETIWETKSVDGVDRIWKSAFADAVVYTSQDLENITAYDVKNRKQLWKTSLANDRSQELKVIRDYFFITTDDQLCAIHRDNGRIAWCADHIIKAQNPVIHGDIVYLFNGLHSGITAFKISNGRQIGRLVLPTYNIISVDYDRRLMVSSEAFLVFASGNQIYAFGK